MSSKSNASGHLPEEVMVTLGLAYQPFSSPFETSRFYSSESIHILINVITQHIEGKNIVMLIKGEQGSGKTTLVRQLTAQAPDHAFFISLHSAKNTTLNTLLSPVLQQQNITYDNNDIRNILKKTAGWIFQNLQHQHFGVLIVDDAHKLPVKTLENLLKFIYAINNQNQGNIKLLLFGEHNVDNLIEQMDKQILSNDTLISTLIRPFNKSQTTDYLNHQFKLAAYRGKPLFTEKQLAFIQVESGGIPGRINILAANCLSARHKTWLTGNHVRLKWYLIFGLVTGFISSGVAIYFFSRADKETHIQHVANPDIHIVQQMNTTPQVTESGITPVDKPTTYASQLPDQTIHSESEHDKIKSLLWLRQQPQDHYMIQITGSWNYEKLRASAEYLQLEYPLVLYQSTRNNQPWYVLLCGPFPDQNAAKLAILTLPESIRQNKPWIRMLDQILKTL